MVDRASPTPLWAQIESELRTRLLKGDFEDEFPSEPDLMNAYQVSRSTVRQAVAALERSGLVERRRGLGTRVTKRPLIDSTARIYSLAGWITRTGLTERSVVPTAGIGTVPDDPAGHLGLDPGDEAVHIMRIRYAGDEPIAIDRSWFPGHVGQTLIDDDLTTGSLYDRLTRAGIIPTSSVEQIQPVNPEPDDRTMLDLPPTEMAFRTQRIVYADSTPVEYRESIIRGDRYTLTATWGNPTSATREDQRKVNEDEDMADNDHTPPNTRETNGP
ncbi:MAG TPA: GntR family transcriptional regulator [Acidimicrobiia bacterium]|jgi:GntR family transcriptional regulator|nr:GntR family transcriptional regulator [Acidimicrobiia bacterium]